MSLTPLDLQTLFVRLAQVGKEQAILKDAAPLQQSLQGSQLAQKTEIQDHSVNETKEAGDGPDQVNEDEEKGSSSEEQEEKKKEKEKKQQQSEIFHDPDLGRNIDISG
ncbi:MAG: hypothetical protein K9L68_03235 [Spirochaetales bacterium]|nr:hypothetical protein [Spirochaetales bacterium]MCF7937591.1 hypothetical protein [Spirochaetales bacterium]